MYIKGLLDGGFKYFIFSPLPGQIVEFQRGWNHQLGLGLSWLKIWLFSLVVERFVGWIEKAIFYYSLI